MDIASFLDTHQLPADYAQAAQKWFNPVADTLAARHRGAHQPLFVGVNGCQGSGKSTLCDYLAFYLTHHHKLEVAVLSLDDFYLPQQQRQLLARTVHPLLQTRGVPGTHNTELAKATIEALRNYQQTILPRFNKATDNPHPQSDWPVINNPVDIVFIEGWCWGIPAQAEAELAEPVNELEQADDPQGLWRHFVNTQLAGSYQQLFATMQYWIMLKAPSFEHVYRWRCEQEHKLAAKQAGGAGVMSDEQIHRFIQHYQRLTEHALAHMPARCDQVFELAADRTIISEQKGSR